MFKVFIEHVTIWLLFYVLVFCPEACGILAPWLGIKPAPPALVEVLNSGPSGKSLFLIAKKGKITQVSISGWVCKRAVVLAYNGLLLSLMEGRNAGTWRPWMNFENTVLGEWKKSDTKATYAISSFMCNAQGRSVHRGLSNLDDYLQKKEIKGNGVMLDGCGVYLWGG